MSIDARILAIAGAQDAVFTAAEARAAGASYQHLAERVRQGMYVRVLRGAYILAGFPLTCHRRVRAVCLVGGAVAAGPSAAALWGSSRSPKPHSTS